MTRTPHVNSIFYTWYRHWNKFRKGAWKWTVIITVAGFLKESKPTTRMTAKFSEQNYLYTTEQGYTMMGLGLFVLAPGNYANILIDWYSKLKCLIQKIIKTFLKSYMTDLTAVKKCFKKNFKSSKSYHLISVRAYDSGTSITDTILSHYNRLYKCSCK